MNRLNAIRVSFVCAAAAALLSSTSANAAFVPGPRAVGAFQSDDDGVCHAVVAQSSGDIVDVSYNCHGGAPQFAKLAHLDGAVAVSGYYAHNDHLRHAIVGLANGDLVDIRYKPGIAPAPIRLANIKGFGTIKLLAAWTDVHDNQNVAILTKWLASSVVVAWQQSPGQAGSVNYLQLYTSEIADLTGEYLYWDNTNKIELAFGNPGAPSTMRLISWPADQTPDQFNITDTFPPSTPWVGNFPGPDARGESIISLSGNIGYYSDYTPWSSLLVLLFLDTNNAIKVFSASNGGGSITAALKFTSGHGQSIAGPYFTGLVSGPVAEMQAVVATFEGHLFALAATQPPNLGSPPAWKLLPLGSF